MAIDPVNPSSTLTYGPWKPYNGDRDASRQVFQNGKLITTQYAMGNAKGWELIGTSFSGIPLNSTLPSFKSEQEKAAMVAGPGGAHGGSAGTGFTYGTWTAYNGGAAAERTVFKDGKKVGTQYAVGTGSGWKVNDTDGYGSNLNTDPPTFKSGPEKAAEARQAAAADIKEAENFINALKAHANTRPKAPEGVTVSYQGNDAVITAGGKTWTIALQPVVTPPDKTHVPLGGNTGNTGASPTLTSVQDWVHKFLKGEVSASSAPKGVQITISDEPNHLRTMITWEGHTWAKDTPNPAVNPTTANDVTNFVSENGFAAQPHSKSAPKTLSEHGQGGGYTPYVNSPGAGYSSDSESFYTDNSSPSGRKSETQTSQKTLEDKPVPEWHTGVAPDLGGIGSSQLTNNGTRTALATRSSKDGNSIIAQMSDGTYQSVSLKDGTVSGAGTWADGMNGFKKPATSGGSPNNDSYDVGGTMVQPGKAVADDQRQGTDQQNGGGNQQTDTPTPVQNLAWHASSDWQTPDATNKAAIKQFAPQIDTNQILEFKKGAEDNSLVLRMSNGTYEKMTVTPYGTQISDAGTWNRDQWNTSTAGQNNQISSTPVSAFVAPPAQSTTTPQTYIGTVPAGVAYVDTVGNRPSVDATNTLTNFGVDSNIRHPGRFIAE